MNLDLNSIVPIILIAITCIVSYQGFNDTVYFNRYKFNVAAIIRAKQWERIITSGFLHADIAHLAFNMISLYFFSEIITMTLGFIGYLIVYFLSIILGNVLTLWVYRRDDYYSAIGASGGVSGVIFCTIGLFPAIGINIMFIPINIPGWLFAIAYLAYSIYGMKNQLGNIGHSAHLGGAVTGILSAIAFYPEILMINSFYIGIMMVPIIILAVMVYNKK